MSKVKFFNGSFDELLWLAMGNLGFKENLTSSTRDEYLYDLSKDVPRTAYYSPGPVSELIEKVISTEELDSLHPPVYIFLQGVIDASLFSDGYLRSSENFLTHYPQVRGALRFCYLNDNHVPCSFSIAYIRDDSNNRIPVKERKFFYAIAVIEGVNRAPDARQVTWFASPEVVFSLPNSVSTMAEVDDSDITPVLSQQLKSKYICSFIPDLFPEGTLSVTAVQALDNRFFNSRNMDNREYKQEGINELCQCAGVSSDTMIDMLNIEDERSIRDFFENAQFTRTLRSIFLRLKDNDMNQRQLKLIYMAISFELLAQQGEFGLYKILRTSLTEAAHALRDNPTEEQLAAIIASTKNTVFKKVAEVKAEINQNFITAAAKHPAITASKPEMPQELAISFGKRNILPLMSGYVATFLIATGIILLLSGALPPMGLVLSVCAVSVLLLSVIKLMYNEYKYDKMQKKYLSDLGNYENLLNCRKQELELLEENTQASLDQIDTSFNTFNQLLADCGVQEETLAPGIQEDEDVLSESSSPARQGFFSSTSDALVAEQESDLQNHATPFSG